MERYDYREESDTAGNVSAEIDSLSVKQLVLVTCYFKVINKFKNDSLSRACR